MNWNDITVGQYQDIYKLSLTADIDEIEKRFRIVCILYNMTEAEVDELSMSKFNELERGCKFILEEGTAKLPGKPVHSFTVNGRKYNIVYDVRQLKHRQYVEIIKFSEDPILNMHYLLASLVRPVKWFRERDNKAEDHAAIAEDMVSAPLPVIYHACIFFCKVYRDLIKATRGSLAKQMIATGMTKEQAERAVQASIDAMDGFIPPDRQPTSKA